MVLFTYPRSLDHSHHKGRKAEKEAQRWLEKQGFIFLAERFRRRGGEIDIVMEDRATKTVMFVEVKYRIKQDDLAFALTQAQQERLHLLALKWLEENKDYQDYMWRFDALLLCRDHPPVHICNIIL